MPWQCDRCYQIVLPGHDDEHGLSRCPYQPRIGSALVKDDTIDFVAENAWREPRHFTSQKAYEQALDESGLMLKPPKANGVEPVSADTLRWAAERLLARTTTYPVATQVLDETFSVRSED